MGTALTCPTTYRQITPSVWSSLPTPWSSWKSFRLIDPFRPLNVQYTFPAPAQAIPMHGALVEHVEVRAQQAVAGREHRQVAGPQHRPHEVVAAVARLLAGGEGSRGQGSVDGGVVGLVGAEGQAGGRDHEVRVVPVASLLDPGWGGPGGAEHDGHRVGGGVDHPQLPFAARVEGEVPRRPTSMPARARSPPRSEPPGLAGQGVAPREAASRTSARRASAFRAWRFPRPHSPSWRCSWRPGPAAAGPTLRRAPRSSLDVSCGAPLRARWSSKLHVAQPAVTRGHRVTSSIPINP